MAMHQAGLSNLTTRPLHGGCVAIAVALTMGACGDNIEGADPGPPLAQADTLMVIAHFDDDMIFMQPELPRAIEGGSLTTIYVTSGDPVHGDGRAGFNFAAARIAYSSVAGPVDWDCGYLTVNDAPVHHCRLRGRPISIIGMDIPDGGLDGSGELSTLRLAQGEIDEVPILGPIGGVATGDSITDTLGALISATAPAQIHALDLAATHGYDHSSHLFSSSFALWAAARIGYAGELRWHRGYNVRETPVTLEGDEYEQAKHMIGYYDACYYHCAPCGTSCKTIDVSHDAWVQSQYSYDRAPLEATGTLALVGAPGQCASRTGTALTLGDCATAAPLTLEATGRLRLGNGCVTSPVSATDPVTLAPCDGSAGQYWVSDSDGRLWNGRIPEAAADMYYDHVRCLSAEPSSGATLTAPICGSRHAPAWQIASAP